MKNQNALTLMQFCNLNHSASALKCYSHELIVLKILILINIVNQMHCKYFPAYRDCKSATTKNRLS